MIPSLPFYLLAGPGTAVVVCLSIELQERESQEDHIDHGIIPGRQDAQSRDYS